MAARIERGASWLALPLLLALAGCPPPTHPEGDDDDDSATGDDDAADDDAAAADTMTDYGPRSCDGTAPVHPDLRRA